MRAEAWVTGGQLTHCTLHCCLTVTCAQCHHHCHHSAAPLVTMRHPSPLSQHKIQILMLADTNMTHYCCSYNTTIIKFVQSLWNWAVFQCCCNKTYTSQEPNISYSHTVCGKEGLTYTGLFLNIEVHVWSETGKKTKRFSDYPGFSKLNPVMKFTSARQNLAKIFKFHPKPTKCLF